MFNLPANGSYLWQSEKALFAENSICRFGSASIGMGFF